MKTKPCDEYVKTSSHLTGICGMLDGRERDCVCGGDQASCDFYPALRERAQAKIGEEGTGNDQT